MSFPRASLIMLLLFAALSGACGKVALGPVGLQSEKVVTAVRDLTSAYERRDLDAFMDKISSAYPDRDGFQRTVETIFSTYQTIHFKLHYNKMIITVQDKGSIKVTFTWEGEWKTSGGRIVKDGSRTTLILDPGVFKLRGIEGPNMFMPSELSTAPVQR